MPLETAQQVLGTAEARARNRLEGALVEDARLTTLWVMLYPFAVVIVVCVDSLY